MSRASFRLTNDATCGPTQMTGSHLVFRVLKDSLAAVTVSPEDVAMCDREKRCGDLSSAVVLCALVAPEPQH